MSNQLYIQYIQVYVATVATYLIKEHYINTREHYINTGNLAIEANGRIRTVTFLPSITVNTVTGT